MYKYNIHLQYVMTANTEALIGTLNMGSFSIGLQSWLLAKLNNYKLTVNTCMRISSLFINKLWIYRCNYFIYISFCRKRLLGVYSVFYSLYDGFKDDLKKP